MSFGEACVRLYPELTELAGADDRGSLDSSYQSPIVKNRVSISSAVVQPIIRNVERQSFTYLEPGFEAF